MSISNRCLCMKGGTHQDYLKMINIDSLTLCKKCEENFKLIRNKHEKQSKELMFEFKNISKIIRGEKE